MVLVGTNNHGHSAQEVAGGITEICHTIRDKQPKSYIIVLVSKWVLLVLSSFFALRLMFLFFIFLSFHISSYSPLFFPYSYCLLLSSHLPIPSYSPLIFSSPSYSYSPLIFVSPSPSNSPLIISSFYPPPLHSFSYPLLLSS